MSISYHRFSLALERLKDVNWDQFEKLSSTFLASEYGSLRTLANSGGDGGRDAMLFSPEGEEETVFQFSVTPNWSQKIRSTIKRLKESSPAARYLCYMSNQEIGAKGDELRKEARKLNFILDIRDRAYFLERAYMDPARQSAAEQLAKQIVDRYLEDKGAIEASGVLTNREANTALLYIEMQQEDEASSKGLTKGSFETLVRAALHGTTQDLRLTEAEIVVKVQHFLPQHTVQLLSPFVSAALKRLKRQAVTQWGSGDRAEYHIKPEELARINEASAQLVLLKNAFEKDVTDLLANNLHFKLGAYSDIIAAIHTIIQTYFLRRGEEFAAAVAQETTTVINQDDISSIIRQNFPTSLTGGKNGQALALSLISNILSTPSAATRRYLRLLSDSYTLMSFLSATPDVQAATRKLFSSCTIWIDAGLILPIMAESAIRDGYKPFTTLFAQARLAGARLRVSSGVVEEIERHLNRCRYYATSSSWVGNVPFVYAQYILFGGIPAAYKSWAENFAGHNDPTSDIIEYLEDDLGIIYEDDAASPSVSKDVRDGLRDFWQQVHADRRRSQLGDDSIAIDRLARHDLDICLTVLEERYQRKAKTKLGQSSWWLTLDRAAGRMMSSISQELSREIGFPLVMSVDFLMRYLAFGPSRDRIASSDKADARVFAPAIMQSVPQDLINAAVTIRESCSGLSTRLVHRRLRDALDNERARIGPIHSAGIDAMEDALREGF